MQHVDSARELAWIRARLRELAPDEDLAVIATNLQGVVAYWNAGAERLYGWSADEALGEPIVGLTPSQTTRAQSEAIMQVLKDGASWRGEIQLRRKDGDLLDAFVVDIPVGDLANGQGVIVGISATAGRRADITASAASLEASLRRRFRAA